MLDELDRVAGIERQMADLNHAGFMAQGFHQPELLKDGARDIRHGMKLVTVATDEMREEEAASLRQIERVQRIQRRMKRRASH